MTPLPSYLKAYRQRSGLSQLELAQLLGFASVANISRYENFERVPHLEKALALEMIFDASAGELFPLVTEKVSNDLIYRVEALRAEIVSGEAPTDRHKAKTLLDMHARLKEYRTPRV